MSGSDGVCCKAKTGPIERSSEGTGVKGEREGTSVAMEVTDIREREEKCIRHIKSVV